MERVAELLGSEDFGQAIVRMWVLAGRRTGESCALNDWERGRDAAASEAQIEAFVAALQREKVAITAQEIERSPLALVQALDRVHALSHTAYPWHDTAHEEEGERYWLVPVELSHRQRAPLARQTGNREAWFKWHAVIPARTAYGIQVFANAATGRVAHALGEMAKDGRIAIRPWIGHFNDEARLRWAESPAKRFRFSGIEPPAEREKSIVDTLERAGRDGAQVLLLPEFTVDLAGRRVVADWLRANAGHPFELVVPGSFHQEIGAAWFNAAEIWNRHGEALLTHQKLRLFGQADGLAEDVGTGNRFSVLVTPIGTLSLLICKDFLDDHPSVAGLLREVPVDWVLVPSYGDESTVRAHKEKARSLARSGPGTTSIVANQRNVEVKAGSPLPGFAHLGWQQDPIDVGSEGASVVLEAKGTLPARSGSRRIVKVVK